MKHLIYISLLLSIIAGLTSCTNDDINNEQCNQQLSLTLQLPSQPGTRFGAGLLVDRLHYVVLSEDGKRVIDYGTQKWQSGNAKQQVDITLLPDHTYQLVFFADTEAAEKAGYTFNRSKASFSIDYSKVEINNDIYDAFYTKIPGVTLDYDSTEAIPLMRPFVQINIGTNDLTDDAVTNCGLDNYGTTFTVGEENLASGISFISTDTQPVTYVAAATGFTKILNDLSHIPDIKDTFPVKDYKYLNMMYLLVNPGTEGKALLKATFTTSTDNGTNIVRNIDLSELPATPNYKTNVYGSLLVNKKGVSVDLSSCEE